MRIPFRRIQNSSIIADCVDVDRIKSLGHPELSSTSSEILDEELFAEILAEERRLEDPHSGRMG